MKRKRSKELLIAASKKQRPNETVNSTNSRNKCPLIQVLAQYGLLESIVSHLFPKDLYSLALSSKATYKSVFPNSDSRPNLFNKMACDGTGIRIRGLHHRGSISSSNKCKDSAVCGTNDDKRRVESRPCVTCGTTTCDECRIHCTYQSASQKPGADDELPEFSGFALLSRSEMRILSPAHMRITESEPWTPGPHHDQGLLDNPIDSDASAPAEWVEDIIAFDLGDSPLQLSTSSESSHPSPVIQTFWDITERRKRSLCHDCFGQECDTGPHSDCRCTLKSHFLERWLCLRCFLAEEKLIQDHFYGLEDHCVCGARLDKSKALILCLWCKGEVANPEQSPPEVTL
ncbi:hypothetical protein BDV95DRAFT_505194 [Massariosphaeria phaeospora]|uniref:Uncharacterized protein n=1 Tax=Massariosphaeria phaeospora TaxID=100035 RepID=A0A7C8M217_9PLEO|nr:hypothetical protein BDV95DRAFT_505194 [Massariosphaeria phaeospora]